MKWQRSMVSLGMSLSHAINNPLGGYTEKCRGRTGIGGGMFQMKANQFSNVFKVEWFKCGG